MPKITLTNQEMGLCMAALTCAAKDLDEGLAASIRMNLPEPEDVAEAAKQMRKLKDKIMHHEE